ncbi:hypothetical protein CI109_103307 [Kwoniella shandongensis]|uniref:Uncharacterized protein n=1 Tax=Kwoniella shandongensis TaxID=1734106 RepID=A0A5M6BNL7_9TREE|nr:uncharacterized protein CI109_007193 [Kwoniella shandongensis]KAA5524486.1 hypothetical protein CI109_007193 [Kwoniella shandongensis]
MDIPPTQVDLVRALESIDHSDILAHHHDTYGDESDQQQHGLDVVDDGSTLSTHFHTPHTTTDVPPLPLGNTTNNVVVPTETAELDLESWTREQLQAEIVKLRKLATTGQPSSSAPTTIESNLKAAEDLLNNTSSIDPTLHGDVLSQGEGSKGSTSSTSKKRQGGVGKRKRTRTVAGVGVDGDDGPIKKESRRDVETGKRVEKERRTELGKVIRTKIRSAIGVGLDDPLPHPNPIHSFQSTLADDPQDQTLSLFVPDWKQMLDETNSAWVTRFVEEIQLEASAGQYPRVPPQDLVPEIIDTAARTAFTNMCKRYMTENDPKGVEKREKYTKKRRRWARKDLKQKRRSRAITDPTFSDLHLPPSALHIDYMSSEYSSAGEDDDEDKDGNEEGAGAEQDGQLGERVSRRRQKWEEMVRTKEEDELTQSQAHAHMGGKGGWAVGISEKVLEVRTPRWRSEQLNDIYRRLDAHANFQAETRANSSRIHTSSNPTVANATLSSSSSTPIPRAGHVAPSHRRFTQEQALMRKGRKPRDRGEEWMWASGMVGVWPSPLPLPLHQLSQAGGEAGEGAFDQVNAEVESGQIYDQVKDGLDQSHGHDHEHEHEHEMDTVGWEDGVGVEMGEAERLGLVNALEGL